MKAIILSAVTVFMMISFQNCGQANGRIDLPLEEGQHEFSDLGCVEGRMCLEPNDVDCYEDDRWYQHDEKQVCPKVK